MRLFIALHFNDEVEKSLRDAIAQAKSFSEKGSFTWDDNLHMTLAFLGECTEEQKQQVIEVMQTIPAIPFTLRLEGVHEFKGKGKGRGEVLWVGVRREIALNALADRLNLRLRLAGFSLPQRDFRPHITLARRIVWKDGHSASSLRVKPAACNINSIHLMWSHRVQGRLVYTSIYDRTF